MKTAFCLTSVPSVPYSQAYLVFILPFKAVFSEGLSFFCEVSPPESPYLLVADSRIPIQGNINDPSQLVSKLDGHKPEKLFLKMNISHPKMTKLMSRLLRRPTLLSCWGAISLSLGWLPLEGLANARVLVARQEVSHLTEAAPMAVGSWGGRSPVSRSQSEVPSGTSSVKSARGAPKKVPHKIGSDLRSVDDLTSVGGFSVAEVKVRDLGKTRLATRLPRELKAVHGEKTVRIEIPLYEGEATATVVQTPFHRPVSPGVQAPGISHEVRSSPELLGRVLSVKTLQASGGERLEVAPQSLVFSEIGETIPIDVMPNPGVTSDLRFFVRNTAVAELIEAKHPSGAPRPTLKSLAVGVTELYIVNQKQMTIVPLEVRSKALVTLHQPGEVFKPLKVSDQVMQLEGFGPSAAILATNTQSIGPSTEQSETRDGVVESGVALAEVVKDLGGGRGNPGDSTLTDTPESPDSPLSPGSGRHQRTPQLSLQQSVDETEQFIKETQVKDGAYETKVQAFEKLDVTIQVVDDRTYWDQDPKVPKNSPVYPIAGAIVEVVGTQFRALTDGTGHLVIKGVPAGARMLVRVRDPAGSVLDGIQEVKAEAGVHRIRTLRVFAFDLSLRLAGVTQIAGTASFCGKVQSPADFVPSLKSFKVEVPGGVSKESYEGPFYFNTAGYLDESLKEGTVGGRFCLFNIKSDAVSLSIEAQGQPPLRWTIPIGSYGSFHQEALVNLDRGLSFKTSLASMGSAHEQLSKDQRTSDRLRSVDFVEAFPLGDSRPMEQPQVGQLEADGGLDNVGGLGHYYVESPEFESALYQVSEEDPTESVTPLIPRGFVEDMALFAQVVPDPQFGTVYTEFSHYSNLEGSVNVRLVDERGTEVGTSWYVSDQPLTKTLFFNVPVGRYSLVVETKDGDWIDAEVVMVYSDTVSHLRLGQKRVVND